MVYGLSYSASFVGMFIGPISGGVIAARFGFTAIFAIMAGLVFANALWVAFGVRPVDPNRGWS